MERLFTDCAKFIYKKYSDRMKQIGHDGDLSSDNDSQMDNSYLDENGRNDKYNFKESGGHKASRLNGIKKRRSAKKRCKC